MPGDCERFPSRSKFRRELLLIFGLAFTSLVIRWAVDQVGRKTGQSLERMATRVWCGTAMCASRTVRS